MRKIDAIIIGSQKSGTSSLNHYLAKHPAFITHQELEFVYFVNDEVYTSGYNNAFVEHFPHFKSGDKIVAKSVGILYEESALKRLYEHNPHVKIIIALRNPIDRAYSAYWYARRMGWETEETFEKSIFKPHSTTNDHWIKNRFRDYLGRSEYVNHIKQVYQYFSPRQVCFVMTEDLRKNAEQTCNGVMHYFGFEPLIKLSVEPERNRSALPRSPFISALLSDRNPLKKYIRNLIPVSLGRKVKFTIRTLNEKEFVPPKIADTTRAMLVDHFLPLNAELSELIKKDLKHWNA